MTGSLLEQAIVYLGAAVVVVPLVKRFKFSAILGYLIAGIIIGPYVLGWVGQSSEEQTRVLHFAEFGVVMMLFLIGLGLRPALLWKLRVPIIGIGGTQVLLTTIAIALLALAFGLPAKAALTVGMILALSSTAIVIQILNEQGLLTTPAGRNIFSVLLFQDIAAIPMLAVLPLLAMSSANSSKHLSADSLIAHYPAWIQVGLIIGTIACIMLAGRFAFKPIFRLVAATQIRELFTALALLIVIGIAWLMQSLGLSPALGAFVAGVVLAESEYRHQLELDIAPFQGLLLGLFFMMVGAGIDFLLLIHRPLLIVLLVALLVLTKFLILLLVGRLFRMNMVKKTIFAFALAQAGEFAFVLFAMSLQLNVLTADIVSILVLVVALSMMLAPLLMIALDKWIMPRLSQQASSPAEQDTVENDNNPVIIAGYGRFGQMIGRLLMANGITATILENNSDHVETIRRFGQKVYYGDATRADLLASAGAYEAKVLVIALADQTKSLELVEMVKNQFPHLRIFVRATSRAHAYELMDKEVFSFERDTRLSALELGQSVLQQFGFHPYRARRATHLFRQHDKRVMHQLFEVYKENRNDYIESSKRNELIIAEILKADMAGEADSDYGWSVVLSDEEIEAITEDKADDKK